jgi:hypothetical protein
MKNILIYIFAVILSCTVGASSEREETPREKPTVIKILPRTKEEILQTPILDPSLDSNIEVHRYANEYGHNFYFKYDTDKINALKEEPAQSDAYLNLLKQMGEYRKRHLGGETNPLIVRFRVYTNNDSTNNSGSDKENAASFSFASGLFVSGWEDYKLKDTKGTPITASHFDIIPQPNLSIIVPLSINLPNPVTGSAAKNAIELKTNHKKLEEEIRKEISEHIKQSPLLEQYNSLKRQKLEGFCTLDGDNPKGKLYKIPHFEKNVFPLSLIDIISTGDNSNAKENDHYIELIQMLFEYDTKSYDKPMFRANIPPLQMLFTYSLRSHDQKNNNLHDLIYQLFNTEILDTPVRKGCFHSHFTYYFSDSEQAFLSWLQRETNSSTEIERGIIHDADPPLIKKSLPSEFPKGKVSRVELEFISFLDMCPICRSTFSFLLGKETSKENPESWLHKKIKLFINKYLGEEYKGAVTATDLEFNLGFDLDISCISLTRCNKPDTSQ